MYVARKQNYTFKYRNKYTGCTLISQLRYLLAQDSRPDGEANTLDKSMLEEPIVLIDCLNRERVWCSGSSTDETLGDAMEKLGRVTFVLLIWEYTNTNQVEIEADSDFAWDFAHTVHID